MGVSDGCIKSDAEWHLPKGGRHEVKGWTFCVTLSGSDDRDLRSPNTESWQTILTSPEHPVDMLSSHLIGFRVDKFPSVRKSGVHPPILLPHRLMLFLMRGNVCVGLMKN